MTQAAGTDTEKLKFQCAVFEVLNYHSLLDLNLGLCIAHLSNPDDPRSEYAKIERMSCSTKIRALLNLIGPNMIESFEAWAHDANSVRAVRNHFAHGVWEYLPAHPSEPVGLSMPPWYASADDFKSRYSVLDVQNLAHEIQVCFENFMEWRQSHAI